MSEHIKLIYKVEEFREGRVQISSLITTNPWLAVSDLLIKARSARRQGFSCDIIPQQKTKTIMHQVIFLTIFFKNKENNIIKEISISTTASNGEINRFEKMKTNDYYLSEQYVSAIKRFVAHLKEFKSNQINGITVLIIFSILNDNHLLWLTYTPNIISDKLVMGGLGNA